MEWFLICLKKTQQGLPPSQHFDSFVVVTVCQFSVSSTETHEVAS